VRDAGGGGGATGVRDVGGGGGAAGGRWALVGGAGGRGGGVRRPPGGGGGTGGRLDSVIDAAIVSEHDRNALSYSHLMPQFGKISDGGNRVSIELSLRLCSVLFSLKYKAARNRKFP